MKTALSLSLKDRWSGKEKVEWKSFLPRFVLVFIDKKMENNIFLLPLFLLAHLLLIRER